MVQSDHNNSRLINTVVAAITSNVSRTAYEATQYLIDVNTPEGMASGLRFNSAVTCEFLATIERSQIRLRLGTLTGTSLKQIDSCLKSALGLS